MNVFIAKMLMYHQVQKLSAEGGEQYLDENPETWRALEEAYKSGKLRSIGVSNFEKADIDNIINNSSVTPMVNQILAHISNTPLDLIEYNKQKGILVEAYSPIGHGELLKNKQVSEIARKYNVTVPQLGIRYCLQLGTLPLPKTANPKHIKINAEIDFEISPGDMELLKGIEQIKDYGEFSKFPVFGKV